MEESSATMSRRLQTRENPRQVAHCANCRTLVVTTPRTLNQSQNQRPRTPWQAFRNNAAPASRPQPPTPPAPRLPTAAPRKSIQFPTATASAVKAVDDQMKVLYKEIRSLKKDQLRMLELQELALKKIKNETKMHDLIIQHLSLLQFSDN